MKGFLIFMALVAGGAVYFFTHTNEITAEVIKKLELEEAPKSQEFRELMYKSPEQFAALHKPHLERRVLLAKWNGLVGDKNTSYQLVRDAREIYGESSLATDPAYGDMIWRMAVGLEFENHVVPAQEALDYAKHYQALFPEGPHRDEISGLVTRVSIKYNFR